MNGTLRRIVAAFGVAVALVASTPGVPAPAAGPKPNAACDAVDRGRVWFNYGLGQTFTTDLDSVSSWEIAVLGFKPFKGRIAGRLMLYPAGDPVAEVGPGIVLAEASAPADVRGREVRWLEFEPAAPVALPLTGSTGRYGIEIDFPVDVTRPRSDWSELAWLACAEIHHGGRAFHVEGAESQQRRMEQGGGPKLPARLPEGGVVRTPHQYQAFTFRVFGD